MYLNEGHKKDSSVKLGAGNKKGGVITSHSSHDIPSLECDEQIIFAAKKAEKLATALYLITDFLDPKEPLKWDLRERAVSFLSFLTLFAHTPSATEKKQSVARVISLASEIVVFLDLGLSARLISQMNYSILKSEYSAVCGLLNPHMPLRGAPDTLILPKDFFSAQQLNKGQNKRHYSKKQETSDNVFYDVEENQTKNITNEQKSDNIAPSVPTGKNGNARRVLILKFLQARGEATIKDISEVVSECSEKTIQRELMSLIHLGKIRRMGERRWSKYVLATSH